MKNPKCQISLFHSVAKLPASFRSAAIVSDSLNRTTQQRFFTGSDFFLG